MKSITEKTIEYVNIFIFFTPLNLSTVNINKKKNR